MKLREGERKKYLRHEKMVHWRTKKKLEEKKKAKFTIINYFEKAKEVALKDIEKASFYVHKARKLAMKYQIRLASEYKRQFCKHCYAYCLPSKTCRIRLTKEKVVLYCYSCKKYSKYGYGREKKTRRKLSQLSRPSYP